MMVPAFRTDGEDGNGSRASAAPGGTGGSLGKPASGIRVEDRGAREHFVLLKPVGGGSSARVVLMHPKQTCILEWKFVLQVL